MRHSTDDLFSFLQLGVSDGTVLPLQGHLCYFHVRQRVVRGLEHPGAPSPCATPPLPPRGGGANPSRVHSSTCTLAGEQFSSSAQLILRHILQSQNVARILVLPHKLQSIEALGKILTSQATEYHEKTKHSFVYLLQMRLQKCKQ